MGMFRTLLGRHRACAALLLACVLAMKALIPAGYMASPGTQLLSVAICADAAGGAQLRQIAMPMKGAPAPGSSEHGKAGMVCAFASHAMASLGGADSPLLALALAFLLAIGLVAVIPPPPAAPLYLRPPLRGPPSTT